MIYTDQAEAIGRALRYVEANLKEDLSLDRLASRSAFSPYYFHRLFQHHVGMTPADYVRKRRLANAAGELLTTDRRILEIALDYRFESQETFTRAFKKQYRMTPGRYRTYVKEILRQQEQKGRTGMNKTDKTDKTAANEFEREPEGWLLAGSHPGDYEMGIDRKIVHQGKASGYLRSRRDSAGGFGTMMQMFKADAYRGTRLRLTGFLKTENVEQWCGLWMRIDGKDQEMLRFDNMSNRPVKGTTAWNPYSVVLDVPRDSVAIAFGVLLCGKGRVWADTLRFDVVNETVPTTDVPDEEELPDGPVNLDFE